MLYLIKVEQTFISVDPLAEQTFEPYSYTGNNPIIFTDPTGMNAEGGEQLQTNIWRIFLNNFVKYSGGQNNGKIIIK